MSEWGKLFESWAVAAVVGCAKCNMDQLIKYSNLISKPFSGKFLNFECQWALQITVYVIVCNNLDLSWWACSHIKTKLHQLLQYLFVH